MARLVRADFLSLRERDFVEASRALGATNRRIIVQHMLPNAIGPIIVNATLTVALSIILESTLSFLGLGVQPPDVSLGLLVDQGQDSATTEWWLFVFPVAFLIVLILSIFLIGDGFREAFDPKKSRVQGIDGRPGTPGRGPRGRLPDQGRRRPRRPRRRSRPSRPVRCWASSASPARASRSRRWPPWGCSPSTLGRGAPSRFSGTEILGLKEKQLTGIRGTGIAMIFQDPMTSLNPVYTIGWQISEAILAHQDITKEDAQARAIELLATVGIPNPAERIDNYPHEFSGGMRQRAVIAIAMANDPT